MQDSARETVPWGPSIACSTPAAIEWVEQWKASNDPSGRFISSHDAATDHANGNGVAAVANGHGLANGAVNGGEVAGGFVVWQKMPEMWCLEMVVAGGTKMSAGSDGKVAWRQTPWQQAHASRGPPRPLRRCVQVPN